MPTTIRPAEAEDIRVLDERLPRGRPDAHSECYQKQMEGKGLYATAWHGGTPTGILFVYWEGPAGSLLAYWEGSGAERVRRGFPDCPVLIDLYVLPEYRMRGIGARLIEYAEAEARRRGFTQVGLDVENSNDVAFGIYARRGYADSGLGGHMESYSVLDENGKEVVIEEEVTFMVKELGSDGT